MNESQEYVMYNGVRMVSLWAQEIEKTQKITTIVLAGKEYPRIKYGDEKEDWGADEFGCHDCGAIKGQYHVRGCDVERCTCCQGQLLSCDCIEEGELEE